MTFKPLLNLLKQPLVWFKGIIAQKQPTAEIHQQSEIPEGKTIKFYSKTGCAPCEFYGKVAQKKFPPEKFEIIKFDEDDDLLPIMRKFGVKHVPFITINNNTVIKGQDLEDLVWAIKCT